MTHPDPTALGRLRAADPARTADEPTLTSADVIERARAGNPAESAGPPEPGRRPGRLLTAVAAAVVLLLVGLLVIPRLGDRATVALPAAPVPLPTADCTNLRARPDAPARLDPGADAVWVCDESGRDLGPVIAPPDALTDDPTALIETYAGLPKVEGQQDCTDDLGPAYRMVFHHPDGTTTQLGGQLYGCQVIGDRNGARTMLTRFLDALLEQRRRMAPPSATPPPPSCTTFPRAFLKPQPPDIVELVVCRVAKNVAVPVELSEADTAVLLDSLRRESGPADFVGCGGRDPLFLLAADAYGDVAQLVFRCDVVWFEDGSGDVSLRWQPTGESLQILQRLARG